MDVLFSVIVPVFNTDLDKLTTCINSVASQDCQDIELVVVDDGSEDISEEFWSSRRADFGKLKYFRQVNQGAAAARNRGIEMAQGEFVYFLDSDDSLKDNASLSTFMEFIRASPALDSVMGSYHAIDNTIPAEVVMPGYQMLEYALLSECFRFSAGDTLIKRSLLLNRKISFREGFICEDEDYIMNVLIESKHTMLCGKGTYERTISPSSVMFNPSDSGRNRRFIGMVEASRAVLNLARKETMVRDVADEMVLRAYWLINASLKEYASIQDKSSFLSELYDRTFVIQKTAKSCPLTFRTRRDAVTSFCMLLLRFIGVEAYVDLLSLVFRQRR